MSLLISVDGKAHGSFKIILRQGISNWFSVCLGVYTIGGH